MHVPPAFTSSFLSFASLHFDGLKPVLSSLRHCLVLVFDGGDVSDILTINVSGNYCYSSYPYDQ